MAGDKEDLPRGLRLEQAQVMGLQRSHAQIQDEMTGIYEQLNTLIQMMQRNNLQPQQRQTLRVPRNNIIEADKDPNRDDEADNRGRPRRQNYNPPTGLKLKIASFRGSSSPKEYLEWIQKVEKVFEWYEYSKERKCKVAALEFTNYALLWWENLKIQRGRNGKQHLKQNRGYMNGW
jgi:hypothetical protein